MIDTLRKQQATWSEVDDVAKEDSRVTMDFNGTIDGEEFEGGKATDFPLEMGAGRMIPGFEEGIVGKAKGEEFTLDVTFPEDYHAENLKGKAAQFAVTLKKVEARELPEITDEFIAKFGVKEGGLDALKAEIRKNMERELSNTIKAKIKEQAIEGLVKVNELDVPKAAVEQEIETLKKQAMQRFSGQLPKGAEAPELPNELFQEQAVRRVKTGLLLGQVIEDNELKADEERVKATIAELASAYEDPSEVVAYYEKNEEMMKQMQNLALEDQAIDCILAQAQVADKEVSFDELMNQQQA